MTPARTTLSVMPIDRPSNSTPPPGPSLDEWRVANALLQALVEDAKSRDVQHQEDVAQLRLLIDDLQRQTSRRWASAEKDIRTLYLAHFSTGKGANP